MNPQDNQPGPDDYGFLDAWENEAQQQSDPLANNLLDLLDDMLDMAEQHIEGAAPIDPTPTDLPPGVSRDESEEEEVGPSDIDTVGDTDNLDIHRLAGEGIVDASVGWELGNIRSEPPVFGIHKQAGRRIHIPPTRFSRGRGGAGLGHSAGRDSMWCPKQQD